MRHAKTGRRGSPPDSSHGDSEGGEGDQNAVTTQIATGFDFEPLLDGNVLIEFYGDDGKTFNKQVVTAEVMRGMPEVAYLTGIAMTQGVEQVKAVIARMGGEVLEAHTTEEVLP